jgi:23S rRNA pseudouridine1911/1915/1917 synthase
MKLSYIINSKKYENVKQVLKEEFFISDRLLLRLKTNQKIYKNGAITSVSSLVEKNDLIEVFLDMQEDNSNIVPRQMYLDIIYEDECMLIINKPPFTPIHPSRAHYEDSLSNGVAYYFAKIQLQKKIRPVNRLDKDTSGIVIFAKNEYIQECLIRQMLNHTFKKEYIAIVNGLLNPNSGTINLPIARKANSIIEREVSADGDNAITHYTVLEKNTLYNFSIVQVLLETGRTHQIRVHFAHIGHPIIGDTLYRYRI